MKHASTLLLILLLTLPGERQDLFPGRTLRDPANGSRLLTFVTDGMGFFLFLGLARAFLV